MTTQPLPARMTADDFLVWAEAQPSGRYELVGGVIVQMAAERLGHVRAKMAATAPLGEAIAASGAACEAFIDGMAVRIDEETVYEPDALVRCGLPLPDDALELAYPMIVVEVVSPSSLSVDSGAKLTGHLLVPSVRHYLVINSDARALTHYRRDAGGEIAIRILREGRLRLDPPGLDVEVESLFAAP